MNIWERKKTEENQYYSRWTLLDIFVVEEIKGFAYVHYLCSKDYVQKSSNFKLSLLQPCINIKENDELSKILTPLL